MRHLGILLTALFLALHADLRSAAAGDNSLPLYAWRNGERVPTVIVPPQAAAVRAEKGGAVEVVDLRAAGEPFPQHPGDVHGRPGPQDEPPWLDAPPWRYEIEYYAGHPISVYASPGPATGYGYGTPGQHGDLTRESYRARRYVTERERGRRFNQRDMARRKYRNLSNHERALQSGLEQLKQRNYANAVISFTMACRLNQGDPAARIHLAQARLGQGHFRQAGSVLRRAYELQPKLVYVSLDLARYYADPEDFFRQVDELGAWVAANPADPHAHFLLGVMEFQRGNYPAAYAAFRTAQQRLPNDDVIDEFLDITRPPSR